jgi:predicted anti-sigma-YlaC factor YlaD
MMLRMSQNNQHISDVLPTYLNGRLDAASAERVRAHLATCGDCRRELSAWEAVSGAARLASASVPAPSPMLMNAVWAKIDAQDKAIGQQKSIQRVAYHLWLVFTRQIPLIHKSIWIHRRTHWFGIRASIEHQTSQQKHQDHAPE